VLKKLLFYQYKFPRSASGSGLDNAETASYLAHDGKCRELNNNVVEIG